MADSYAYQANPEVANAIKRKYDVYRDTASQQANKATGQQQDALQRKFASLGMVNSGEAIKQGQLAAQNAQEQAANANAQIGAQEAGENAQATEQEIGRQFQAGEAQKGRSFATSEREASQGFSKSEREAAQGFSKGLFDIEQAFKEKQQNFTESSFAKQWQQQLDAYANGNDQWSKTYDLEREAQSFNEDVARGKYDKPTLMQSLMGGGAGGKYAGTTVNRWSGGRTEGYSSPGFM